MNPISQHELDAATKLIGGARDLVVLTGAGISTESGIPDFRSPGGVWERFRPIEYGDFVRSPDARREHWRYKLATVPVMLEAEPNAGHSNLHHHHNSLSKISSHLFLKLRSLNHV